MVLTWDAYKLIQSPVSYFAERSVNENQIMSQRNDCLVTYLATPNAYITFFHLNATPVLLLLLELVTTT